MPLRTVTIETDGEENRERAYDNQAGSGKE